MTVQRRELYRSAPNGDRWSLVRETASERVFIEHQPNASSGGQTTHIEIGTSLCTAGMAPSIRSCCGLSEHWSRSPLRPKGAGTRRY
jgi:hypothetical protein